MRIVRLAIIAVVLTIFAEPVRAQRIVDQAWHDLKHGALDIGFVWSAPARIKTRDLPAIGVVGAISGVTLIYDDELQAWLDDHPKSLPVEMLRPFRMGNPGEELGDIWFFIRGSVPVWLIGLILDSQTLREGAMGCASAGVAQTFFRRFGVYNAIARTRPDSARGPYEIDVPGKDEWKHKSFYGGHAANAMTCISYLNNRFDMGLLEPVLYAAALGTGLARIVDGAHWSSDTVVGIAAGYAFGRAVALRMKARAGKPAEAGQEHGAYIDYDQHGLILAYRIRL